MAKDALERLFEDAMNSSNIPSSQYSLDDNLDIDDDFLGFMGDSSKDTLLSRIQKVELDDNKNILEDDELNDFNENIKSALDYNLVDESNKEEEKQEENNSGDNLFGKVELDTSEEDDADEEVIEEKKEEEPVVEQKRGRGRPRKKPLEDTETVTAPSQTIQKSVSNISTENLKSLNDFMDSLARDLINELRESNYRTHNFNKKQMDVILNYIENKI